MKRTAIVLFLVALSVPSFATSDWRGKVVDGNGKPLPYATVALLSQADSSVIAGTTSGEDGTFSIVTAGDDGILMAAMVGYRTRYLKPADSAVIRLESDGTTLAEASVTAVMPKTKLTGEGLQTSVRGSVLENSGTANDVLGKTPGMIRGRNGLEVIGKGTPLYYINGRKVSDATELDRLPSNEVQSVEVITNPGAQYDASVRSVVRIRTVKHQGDGFGFNVTLKDEQSLHRAFNDPNANIDVNYRINSVDIFAGTNIYRYSSRQDSYIVSETFGKPSFSNDGWVFNDCVQKSVKVNAGVNWQIAASHSVGFKATYAVNYAMDQYQELFDKMKRDGQPYDETFTKGNYRNGGTAPHFVNTNAYYNGLAGKLGIDFNFDWYRMYDSNLADIIESSSQAGGDSEIKTSNSSDNNLYAAKLVLSYPVWKGQLQVGTEETFSRRSDEYSITGSLVKPSSSKVREDNVSTFASYGVAFPKVGQFSAGVRYEHVNYAYDDLTGSDSFSRKYDNFFPTLSYAGAIGPVQIMANYSEKTSRPRFDQLSSAVRYNSKYIIQSGNATLQPQIIRDVNLMVNWKWLTFSADYSRIDDAVVSWSSQYNDEGVMLVKPRNLDSPMRGLTAFLNATPTVGIWALNYTAGVIQQWLRYEAEDPREASGKRETSFSDRPIAFAQLFNTLTFKKGWQLELGGEIHTPGYTENVMVTNTYFDLTAAVQKAFLKDRSLILRLEGKDITYNSRFDVRTDYGSISLGQTNAFDTQRIVLSVRYRFNAAQSKYKGTGAGSDAVRRMK